MSSEHLCLKWNNFEHNIASYLDILRNENDFVDVTITCGDRNFKAHKVILSACSPYFKGIFQENPCRHPVIILKNVSSNEMEAIMQYIYTGETFITKDELPSFLNTANLLQIIGLINYNLCNINQSLQNGTVGHKGSETIHHNQKNRSISNNSSNNNNSKPNIVPKKFPKSDESNQKKQVNEPVSPKKRTISSNSDSDHQSEASSPKTEDACPILSKQLLLPKKRKLSIIDQNKNVEFYDNSEFSNSSEENRESSNILRGCLGEKTEGEAETEETPTFPNIFGIKKENVESENVLEPEVGLCIKEENEFESTSEESLHNGDILLQRLQSFQDSKSDGQTETSDEHLLKIPKPDITIFSKKLKKPEGDGENLTLTPNVEIFLRNANNNNDNLIHRLANINLFKSKQCKKLKKAVLPKLEVIPGTSKCDKESSSVKNGGNNDNKTIHLTNLPCPHCRQEYNNLSALKYHVRLMHSDLENKLFCYLCPMNFIEREYFKIHLWEAHKARF